jgi:hypothetical protein
MACSRRYMQEGELVFLPCDIEDKDWEEANLRKWRDPRVSTLNGVNLLPLEAKALHVIGTLVGILNSVGYLLYCGREKKRPYPDYYLYAYLLACTAIELMGRCWSGETNMSHATLEVGLKKVGLETVVVNVNRSGRWEGYQYDTSKLIALRNLAAHGQAVATKGGKPQEVFLSVELLDSFPGKLMAALDSYYCGLWESSDSTLRKNLAAAAVEPVLYSGESGDVYVSPMKKAYEEICLAGKRPSLVLEHTDWQVYSPNRDRTLQP